MGTNAYGIFRLFYEHVLPFYAYRIQSLKLFGYDQLRVFKPYIPRLISLKFLSIETKDWEDYQYQTELVDFLTEVSTFIKSLRQLSVITNADINIESIISKATNLTALTFVYRGESWTHPTRLIPMISLKSLTLDYSSNKYVSRLLHATPNLEEFTLSIVEFHTLQICNVPANLRKLTLKVNNYRQLISDHRPDLKTIQTFLNTFRNEIRHLTLIIYNADKTFSHFDKLQTLVQDFLHLQTFHYYIRTDYHPPLSDVPFFPYIEQFPDSRIPMKELYNCHKLSAEDFIDQSLTLNVFQANFQLENLRTIELNSTMDESWDDTYQFMVNVIHRSPHLQCLEFYVPGNTIDIIKQLHQMFSDQQRKQILDLQLWIVFEEQENFHSTFWLELANALPKLRKLRLLCHMKYFYQSARTLHEFVLMIRNLFSTITRLEIRTRYFTRNCMEIEDDDLRQSLGTLQREFNEYAQRHSGEIFFYNCTERVDSSRHTWLDIWL